MAKQTLIVTNFEGGVGTISEKRDIRGAARFIKRMNPYQDSAYIVNSQEPTDVSSSTITGLPHWMKDGSPWDTNRYVYDEDGEIYEVDSGDTVTNIHTAPASSGNGLAVYDNGLYYTMDEKLGRYSQLTDATPAFDDDIIDTFDFNQDTAPLANGGANSPNTYTLQTSITDNPTSGWEVHRQTFTPSKDPLWKVIIDVNTIGTGDWTLTVHDLGNQLIAETTILNGAMGTGQVEFEFTTPGRMQIGNQYHFHVTSTVADGLVNTGTASSLEGTETEPGIDLDTDGAFFETYFETLVNVPWHPMVIFKGNLIIGNERYLAQWTGGDYNPNRVSFASGYRVRSIATFEEFIVVAAHKSSDIYQSEEARLYYWDGEASSFNNFIDCTIGVPNAIQNSRNNLIGVYGLEGNAYQGSQPFQKVVDDLPKLADQTTVEVFPGAISEYRGRTVIGYAALTDDDTSFEQGIYEYGKSSAESESAFNYPYQLSTGNSIGTDIKVGMVSAFGNDIYWGWEDAGNFGLDKVTIDSSYADSGSWESLIFDSENPDKEMLPYDLIIDFEPLTTGQTITPKYKLDRASSWTTGTAASAVGDVRIEFPIFTRAREIEFGFDYTSTSNTRIKVTNVFLKYDDLAEERMSE